MEIVMIVLILTGAAILIGYGITAWARKRRDKAKALATKEAAANQAMREANRFQSGLSSLYPAGNAYRKRYYQPSNGTISNPVPQQTTGIDPLTAGMLGYMLGSSGSHHDHSSPAPVNYQGGGGESGGAGATSSWNDSSNSGSSSDSSSSSSDSSSSSSDSGSSSSDSGSSSSSSD